VGEVIFRGMSGFVFVSLFDNRAERCPFGHDLGPGRVQISWSPMSVRAREGSGPAGPGDGAPEAVLPGLRGRFQDRGVLRASA
jgi:hypothetical protein